MDDHLKITFHDVADTTLLHTLDLNRRSEQDLSMWLSDHNQFAIEYSNDKPELTLTADFNNLYVEFEDSDGKRHKVRLL